MGKTQRQTMNRIDNLLGMGESKFKSNSKAVGILKLGLEVFVIDLAMQPYASTRGTS